MKRKPKKKKDDLDLNFVPMVVDSQSNNAVTIFSIQSWMVSCENNGTRLFAHLKDAKASAKSCENYGCGELVGPESIDFELTEKQLVSILPDMLKNLSKASLRKLNLLAWPL